MNYVELHCHSNFSFLDGASHPEDLARRAAELGYPALALTDHNGLYGIVRFSQAAKEHGVRPIFGAEISLTNGHHLILLARNSAGYANLSQLLSAAQLENPKGNAKVTREQLESHRNGLIALSGCVQGEIPALLIKNEVDQARDSARQMLDLFGKDSFYLELQHHNLPRHELLCQKLARLGRQTGIPLVATNNVHFALAEQRRIQDVLTCIKNHVTLDDAKELLYPNGERYLKSPQQMAKLFASYPEAVENSLAIASRCDFALTGLKTSLDFFHVKCVV